MSHKSRNNRKHEARFSKGDAAIILIVILAIGLVYQFLRTTPTTPTPPALSSTTSTAYIPLQDSDFNITYSRGCLDPNEINGKIYARYYIAVFNRFNETVHYMNVSFVSSVLLSNTTKIGIPDQNLLGLPTYINTIIFPVHVGVTGKGFEHANATFILAIVTVNVEEGSLHITRALVIPIHQGLSQCST